MPSLDLPSGRDLPSALADHLDREANFRTRRADTGTAHFTATMSGTRPVNAGEAMKVFTDVIRRERDTSELKPRFVRYRQVLQDFIDNRLATQPGISAAQVVLKPREGPEDNVVLTTASCLIEFQRGLQSPNVAIRLCNRRLYENYLDEQRSRVATDALACRTRREVLREPLLVEELQTTRTRLVAAGRELAATDQPRLGDVKQFLAHRAVYFSKFGIADESEESCAGSRVDEMYLYDCGIWMKNAFGQMLCRETNIGGTIPSLDQVDGKQFTISDAVDMSRMIQTMEKARLEFQRAPSLSTFAALHSAHEELLIRAYLNGEHANFATSLIALDAESPLFSYHLSLIQSAQKASMGQRKADAALIAEFTAQHLDRSQGAKRSRRKGKTKRQSSAAGPSATRPALTQPVDAATEAEDTALTPSELHDRIYQAARSEFSAVALEGKTAQSILENFSIFSSIVGFNQFFYRDDASRLAEVDVHLDNAIVECTNQSEGKNAQLRKYLNDQRVNSKQKAVILYAPNYTEEAEAQLPPRVILARNAEQLGTALFALKGRELGWVRNA